MLFVPLLAINEAKRRLQTLTAEMAQEKIVLSMVILALVLLLIWGVCAVLIVGKRLLAAKAGRSRSSLKVVMREARGIIIPIVLTGIVRTLIATLWSLLFVIPGIVYLIRTSLHSIVIAEENIAYLPALQKSAELMKGHAVRFLGRMITLALLLTGIPHAIISALGLLLAPSNGVLLLLEILRAALNSMSIVLLLLSLVLLFSDLRPHKGPIMGGGKKK
jgi:hypothetical protein